MVTGVQELKAVSLEQRSLLREPLKTLSLPPAPPLPCWQLDTGKGPALAEGGRLPTPTLPAVGGEGLLAPAVLQALGHPGYLPRAEDGWGRACCSWSYV